MVNNFVKSAKGFSKNPLGIIALFISMIYGLVCLVLGTSISNFDKISERLPLIWFIIIFPILIFIGFIYLVIRHHEKLYSPRDYVNPEYFLRTFPSNVPKVTKDNINVKENLINVLKKQEKKDLFKSFSSLRNKRNLKIANDVYDYFYDNIKNKIKNDIVKEFSFGIKALEYYTFKFLFNGTYLNQKEDFDEVFIMRVTKYQDKYYLIGIGMGIIEVDTEKFADRLYEYIFKEFYKKISNVALTDM